MTGNVATGSCLCGAVTYTVDQPLREVIVCHCTDCQKASGAGASHNIVVKSAAITITSGTPRTYAKTVDSGRVLTRSFCGDCGSQLFASRNTTPEMSVLKAGTLDDRSGLVPVMDIWTVETAAFAPCLEGLPQFPGNRPQPKPD